VDSDAPVFHRGLIVLSVVGSRMLKALAITALSVFLLSFITFQLLCFKKCMRVRDFYIFSMARPPFSYVNLSFPL